MPGNPQKPMDQGAPGSLTAPSGPGIKTYAQDHWQLLFLFGPLTSSVQLFPLKSIGALSGDGEDKDDDDDGDDDNDGGIIRGSGVDHDLIMVV